MAALQYKLVAGAPAAMAALVQTQIDAGWVPLGVPYVSGAGDLQQIMIKDGNPSFAATFAITAVSSGAAPGKSFTVSGNQTKYFNVGFRFTVTGSTGNDAVYTVVTDTYSAPNTVIVVKEAVPSAVVDGTIVLYSAS